MLTVTKKRNSKGVSEDGAVNGEDAGEDRLQLCDLSKTERRNADGVDQPRRNSDEGDAEVELILVRPREKDGDVSRQW